MNLNLSTFGSGALQERFDRELEKVAKNLKDPNTSYKEARKITITFTLKQDEDRKVSACTCEVQSKLAKAKPFDTTLGIGRDLKTDQYVVKEYGAQIPGQLDINDIEPVENEQDNLKKFNKQKLASAMGG